MQTEKIGEVLERVFKWMQENDECYKRPPVAPNAALTAPKPTESAIPPTFVKDQEEINKKLITHMKTLSQNVDKLLDVSQNMLQHTEVAFKSSPVTQEKLSKIEDHLVSYSLTTPAPPPPAPVIIQANNTEFENNVIKMFEEVNTGLAKLKDMPQPEMGLVLADKEFIQHLNNETLSALENVKSTLLEASDKGKF